MDTFSERQFLVVRDIEASCFVHVTPLLSEHTKVIVRAGEILDVAFVPPFDWSRVVSCRPPRYEALEAEFIDAATREKSTYGGYHLLIVSLTLRQHCRPLSDVS